MENRVLLRGAGIGGEFVRSPGALRFIWVVLSLGVSGTFSVVLSIRGLRSLPSGGTG